MLTLTGPSAHNMKGLLQNQEFGVPHQSQGAMSNEAHECQEVPATQEAKVGTSLESRRSGM